MPLFVLQKESTPIVRTIAAQLKGPKAKNISSQLSKAIGVRNGGLYDLATDSMSFFPTAHYGRFMN